MQFDVFVSYASHDKATADAACAALERAGIRCWIAPRDILPGADWGEAIMNALDTCRAMVLIFSSNANSSPQIRREIERVVGRGVPVLPVRIEDTAPTKAMAYFMGPVHWLDALTPPLEQHLHRLADSLKSLLEMEAAKPAHDAPPVRSEPAAPAQAAAPTAAVTATPESVARPLPRWKLLAMRAAVLIATAIGGVLTVATIVYKVFGWLPVTAALTFISYWLVFRNLTAQLSIAKIAALCCGLVWTYLAIWNAAAPDIGLVVIEGTAAACLLYVATELARMK
jgi:TIR domain-containing protein